MRSTNAGAALLASAILIGTAAIVFAGEETERLIANPEHQVHLPGWKDVLAVRDPGLPRRGPRVGRPHARHERSQRRPR